MIVGWIALCLEAVAYTPQDTAPPEDPKKEVPQLVKNLDDADSGVRQQSFAKLKELGEVAANALKSKLKQLRTNWLQKYKDARREAYAAIRKGRDMKTFEELKTKALDAFKRADYTGERPLVEQMWKIYFPDMTAAGSNPKVAEAAARMSEIEPRLGEIGEKTEDVGKKIADLAAQMDLQARWELMPGDDAVVMQKNHQVKGELSEEEYRLVLMTNEYRVMMGRKAVEINVKLCRASRGHSKDMKEKGFFSHDSPVPGKQHFGMRAAKEGTFAASENIARTGPRAEDAFWGWFSSDGHHKNMMANWRQIGVGNFGEMWTENF
jgi:uncharacterized protein YkwD